MRIKFPYRKGDRQSLQQAIAAQRNLNRDYTSFNFNIMPYPYQREILDRLEAERKIRGHCRNLVVAATGTGKTVISAAGSHPWTSVSCLNPWYPQHQNTGKDTTVFSLWLRATEF